MFCNKCGAQLPDTAKFCAKCGNRMAPAASGQKSVTDSRPVRPDARPTLAAQPAWAANQAPMSQNPIPAPVPAAAPVQKAPPVREPAPEPAAPARKVRQIPELGPKPSAGKRVAAVFLCIFIFLFGLAGSLLGSVRIAYSPSGIDRMLDNADIGQLTTPGGEELWKMVYDAASEDMNLEEQYGIDSEEFRQIMSKKFVTDAVRDTLTEVSAYLFNGGDFPERILSDIAETIKENETTIAQVANKNEPRYVWAEAEDESSFDAIFDLDGLREELGEKNLEVSESKKITEHSIRDYTTETMGVDLPGILVPAFSLWMLLLVCGVVLALLVLLFVLLRWYLRSAFTRSGVTFIVLGALVTLGGGAVYVVANLVLTSTLLSTLVNPLAIGMLIIGGLTLIVGLLFVIVIRPLCKKRDDKSHAEDTPAEEPAV